MSWGGYIPGVTTPEKPRLYVSGPMTGREGHNFPAFNQAAARLRAAGFEVENPADKGIIPGWEWVDYMRYDIKVMMDCGGVALTDQWWMSPGANEEVRIANLLKMPVKTVDEWIAQVGAFGRSDV